MLEKSVKIRIMVT